MARIRTIKPELAKHEALFEEEQATRLPLRFAWVMLLTVCDREGRFRWRPRSLKVDVLPYDSVDFEQVLQAYERLGMVQQYTVRGERYGWIPTFTKHQSINNRESDSAIPPFSEADEVSPIPANTLTRDSRVNDATATRLKGKGREGKGKEGKEGSSATAGADAKPPADESPEVLVYRVSGPGGPTWSLRQRQIDEWAGLFPGVDVLAECRKALAWTQVNNPKTASGMPRFLVAWLTKATNQRGGVVRFGQAPAAAPRSASTPAGDARMRRLLTGGTA